MFSLFLLLDLPLAIFNNVHDVHFLVCSPFFKHALKLVATGLQNHFLYLHLTEHMAVLALRYSNGAK